MRPIPLGDDGRTVPVAVHTDAERLAALVRDLDGVIWEADPATGRYSFMSPRAREVLGHDPERLVREPGHFASLVHPEDRERVERLRRSTTSYAVEYRVLAGDGRSVWLRDSVTIGSSPDGRRVQRGLTLDVTQRRLTEARLAAQNALAAALSSARTLEDAGDAAMQAIAGSLGWDVGALWVRGADERLRCAGFYRSADVDPAFEGACRLLAFAPGEGIPGAVWAEARPSWISDLGAETVLPRARIATAAGIRSAIAVPLMTGEVCRGVLELLARQKQPPDEELTRVVANLAAQLARFHELQEAQARRSAAFDASLDCVITIDARGIVTEWNAASERTFRYAREEAIGREMADLIVPFPMREAHRRGLARVVATGQARVLGQRLELTAMRKGGEEFPCELTIVPLPGAAGGFTGFLRDITDRKRAEDALRQSEARLAAFHGGVPIALFATTPDGRFLEANAAFARMLGYDSVQALMEKPVGSLYADAAERQRVMAIINKDGSVQGHVVDFVRRDGGRVSVSISARVIRDAAGAPVRYEGALEDVTERIAAQREIGMQKALLEAQMESVLDGLLVVGLDGRILSANARFAELWGIPDEVLATRDVAEARRIALERVEDRDTFLLGLRYYEERANDACRDEVRLLDGRVLDRYGAPVRGADGRLLGRIWSYRDITERKRAEEALRTQRAILQAQMNGVPEAILVVSANGSILAHNTVFTAMWGLPDERLDGRHGPKLKRALATHAQDPATFVAAFERLQVPDPKPVRDEVRLKDGRILERYGSPIRGEHGESYGRVWTFRDVTTAKRAEERMRALLAENLQQRARLDAIVRSLPGIVWESWSEPDASKDRADFVNEEVEPLLGYSAKEWTDASGFWLRIVHPDERASIAAQASRILLEGDQGRLEFRWVKKNGEPRWMQAVVVAIRDHDGKPLGLRGVALDITALKRVEEELRDQGALLDWQRNVLESIASGAPLHETLDILCREAERQSEHRRFTVLLVDAEGKRLRHGAAPSMPAHYNAAVDGIPIGEGVGSCGTAAHRMAPVHVADIATDPLWKDFRSLALTVGLRACWSTPIRGKDGKLLGTWAIYSDEPGTPQNRDAVIVIAATRLAAIAIERAAAERELQESEARYRFLAENSSDAIVRLDPEGRFLDASPAIEALLGCRASEIVGRRERELVHPEDAAAARPNERYTVRYRRAGGSYVWVEVGAQPVRDQATGEIIETVCTLRDISERRKLEASLRERAAELARAAAMLERSNQELDQFAYVTSHDLKAPLRGIANLSRWIEEDLGEHVNASAKEHLDLLRGRVQRMESLIDAILEYSRVGRKRTRVERVDVGTMLGEVTDLLAPPEGFRIDVSPGMPELETERAPLQQVFMNLLGNAIKHHPDKPRGRVAITHRDLGAFHEFSVADNGRGIAKRYHSKVFVIFQTLEARDKVEGTGIGLALVKKIVERYGGSIRLDSDEGQGATFTFTWPKQPPLPETDPA